MKKKAIPAEKKNNSIQHDIKKDNPEKESLDTLIKNNTDERKSRFMHYIAIVRYSLALFVLFAGIVLRYASGKWNDLSSVMIIVGILMLFIAALRLIFRQNLPIGEKALYSEVRSQRLALTIFFLYVFIMLISYRLMPADLDIYFVLGYGAAVIPVLYIFSYRFFNKTE
jgi:hypothetical protein